VHYHFSDFSAAKPEFEKTLRIADSEFAAKMKVLEWFESTTSALDSLAQPGAAHKARSGPRGSMPN